MVSDKDKRKYFNQAYELMQDQIVKAEEKWGKLGERKNFTKYLYMTVLMEEVGELARGVLNKDFDNELEEAAQVAAISLLYVEYILEKHNEVRND